MAKNSIFSNKNGYKSKYYGPKATKAQKLRKVIRSFSQNVSGTAGHSRYTAIMDMIPESERDHAREQYASDEVFTIGEYMSDLTERRTFKEAEEYYNQLQDEELNQILAEI